MSNKFTRIFYPPVIKIYETKEQLISESGNTNYETALLGLVGDAQFNVVNYEYKLTTDKTALVTTVEFASQEDMNNFKSYVSENFSAFPMSDEITEHLF